MSSQPPISTGTITLASTVQHTVVTQTMNHVTIEKYRLLVLFRDSFSVASARSLLWSTFVTSVASVVAGMTTGPAHFIWFSGQTWRIIFWVFAVMNFAVFTGKAVKDVRSFSKKYHPLDPDGFVEEAMHP